MAREHRLQPGAVFAGVYEVASLVGQGTMGSVYRVRELPTGLDRALKLMKPELLDDPKFPARFSLEARIGERIASPHVVHVVASGVDKASGLPWLAMEFLEGRTLAEWLETSPPPAQPVVRRVLDQLFEAVAAAHAANIVHRDLKPENVILTRKEGDPDALFVKVLDFGIAKIVSESKTLTGTTPGLGTPLWTAPEQSKEGPSIRPAADVWALGLITFRMLTGKMFWRTSNEPAANAFEIAVELMRAPIPPASERARELGVEAALPILFDRWFSRAVARDPAARFAGGAEAHAALQALLDPPSPRRTAAGTIVMPTAAERMPAAPPVVVVEAPLAPQAPRLPAPHATPPTVARRVPAWVLAAIVFALTAGATALWLFRAGLRAGFR